jgi:acylphosphatase
VNQGIANTASYCVRVVVQGRVQGVGFRYFARERAASHGLGGYVRNLPGGEVEVRAAGSRHSLDALVCDLRRGPRMSSVVECIVEWTSDHPASFTEFTIRP